MKKSVLFLLVYITSSLALASPKDFYYERFRKGDTAAPPDSTTTGSYQQRINPADPDDVRTFSQRYYVDASYATSKASPVLFYLCGESTCTANHLGGATRAHAKQHGAYLVALEHRYYGKSQPFDQLTTENLAYLSTDNALLDARAFQEYLTQELQLSGKWIVVGGSYPGSLAAYYRLQYPMAVAGALASSGPVMAKANFEEYDKHVATVAGPKCLAHIQAAVREVEKALENPEALAHMKKQFEAEVLVEDLDFVYLVADMAALAIQYGYKDTFCELLDTEGPLHGYATFTKQIYQSWGLNALSLSAQGAVSLDPLAYEASFGMRQWFYQSCTEFGYWQNAYHDPTLSARSPLINAEYHQDLCTRLFGITEPVNTAHINETFYRKLLLSSSSEVYFTNGSEDPWMNLSIVDSLGNTTNPNHYYMTIEGAAHCDDLGTPRPSDSEALKEARKRFSDLLTHWLK